MSEKLPTLFELGGFQKKSDTPIETEQIEVNKGGRPRLFNTEEEIFEKAKGYFQSISDSKGKVKVTISGLAYYLGFESRQSLYDYENDAEFSYIIKRLRLFVEHCYESQLYTFNATGAIFALKNMGWKDKVETENNSVVKVLNANVELVPAMSATIARSEKDIPED